MNLRMYDKNTRMLKNATLGATGVPIPMENDLSVVGIIDCTGYANTEINQNITLGIRKENGIVLNFSIPNFDYVKSITSATAKYSNEYTSFVAKSIKAIAKVNMLDCVVAIVDNDIMGLGALIGATQINCPIILMPVGINKNYDESIFGISGKVAIREIKSTSVEDITKQYNTQYGISSANTISTSFFTIAEYLNLTVAGVSAMQFGSGEILTQAIAVGTEAFNRANNIVTTKRLINKKTLAEAITKMQENDIKAPALLRYKPLFDLVDVKLPKDSIIALKSTLAEEAYIASINEAPLNINDQAWVYESISDAVTALISNAIESGVIVIKNAANCDVSIVVKTIMAMNKQDQIAVMTDGYCSATPVLTVTNILPDSYANEDFANIHTADTIEIDVAKGRINTNVSSKDMKIRAKRNVTKKNEIYF